MNAILKYNLADDDEKERLNARKYSSCTEREVRTEEREEQEKKEEREVQEEREEQEDQEERDE